MKVWSTKYALTQGIVELEGTACGEVGKPSTMIYIPAASLSSFPWYLHKPFWHETREAAVAHAEKLRANKLKALAKQVKKIEDMVF